MSIVRENLMTRPGYSPYCGNGDCWHGMPRTAWDGEQFKCLCGWRSQFPADFIAEYKAKWGIEDKPRRAVAVGGGLPLALALATLAPGPYGHIPSLPAPKLAKPQAAADLARIEAAQAKRQRRIERNRKQERNQ